jgi:F-type H+-transporting ATPase subunit epsilon
MENYFVDILTPDKVVAKDVPVKDISVSTIKGEVNILANHTHFITNLLTGLMTLRCSDKDMYFTVENGICKILGDKITILSSTSYAKDDIDSEKTQLEVSEINGTLSKTDLMSDEKIDDLYQRLEVLKSHLKIKSL